jgi:perosamine synthetase
MIARPKQIIYPLRYFGRAKASENALEHHLASFLGDDIYLKLLGRARAGIYLLTKLAVRDRRRKVILSPYTIPDVVNMVKFAGGDPVFVDFLPRSTNIDVEHLSNLMDERTCCVLVTHYHFNQNAMEDIFKICAANDIMLIDDCALSFCHKLPHGQSGHTTHASVFSFSGFKTLNFFWGGAVATSSPDLAQRLSSEIDKWPRMRWGQYGRQMINTLKYDLLTRGVIFSSLTFPLLKRRVQRCQGDISAMARVDSARLDETILSRPSMQAIAEWDRKLGTVDQFVRHRRAIAAIYISELPDQLVSSETAIGVRKASCLVNCPIYVDAQRRGAILQNIFNNGFDVGVSLYPNVHELPGFNQVAGHSNNVARLVRSVITLPTHPRISEEYASQLSTVVRRAIMA